MTKKLKYYVEVPEGTRWLLNWILLPNVIVFVFLDWEEFGRIFTGLIFCVIGIVELINGGIAYFVAYREVYGLFKSFMAFVLAYIFYQWLIPMLITTF